ncbi:MAG: adenylate/guanylate cyclase domain-containing protein [Pseudomonadota bacterium]
MADAESSKPSEVTVLFADVVGSTKLYEEHGDANAREALSHCVQVMLAVTERFKGRLKKTIGDEIMIAFDQPVHAVLASNELHIAVRNASEAGEFVTGALRIKVGFHHDAGDETDDDVKGPAARIAQQVIGCSKADQILVTKSSLSDVPAAMSSSTRYFDIVPAEGTGEELEIVEMIWEVSDATQMVGTPTRAPQQVVERSLTLHYEGRTIEMGKDNPSLTVGRVDSNDLMVPTDLTSRNHAEIEYRNGHFHLTDMSSNGTVVVDQNGQEQQLRREGTMLRDEGRICFGGIPVDNPTGLVDFKVD